MATPTILSAVTGDSARARTSDPSTSHEAADSISTTALEDSEREVLAIVRGASRPLCAQEIEKAHDLRAWNHQADQYSSERIGTAFKQLRDAGVVVQQGETRTVSGRRARAWVAVDADDAAVATWLAEARQRRLTAVARRDHDRRSNRAKTRAA